MNFKIVIPARYASTRLPGKPLLAILDKPMIQWVYEAAVASHAEQVIVATDDERIMQAVEQFGGDCCQTRADHATGTDRIVEVCEQKGWSDDTIIVNLQGDEPLMPAQNLSQVAQNLADTGFDMATLHKPIDGQAAEDPNLVKLVTDQFGSCLYFSRSKIPFNRDRAEAEYAGHIGLYAYRVGFLKAYANFPPCMLEQSEKLEQLRALFYGFSIHSQQAHANPGPGIDTEDDLQRVIQLIEASH